MPKPSNARVALYPGSFDPVTRGHLDIIERAAPMFDTLVVAVIANPSKLALFTVEERVAMLEAELPRGANIEVRSFSGLAVQAAARFDARWIVRGLRSQADAAYELPMAGSNRRCGEGVIETVLLPASPELAYVSSTLVREIAAHGGRLEAFVTPAVERALAARARRQE